MNKTFAVFKREYFQAVRKKMFIIMTFLLPLLMAALMLLPAMLTRKGISDRHVVVIDGTGRLEGAVSAEESGRPADSVTKIRRTFIGAAAGSPEAVAAPWLEKLHTTEEGADRVDGVLLVPARALEETDARLVYYSRSVADIIVQERLARQINRTLQRIRLQEKGVDPTLVGAMLTDLRVDAVQISKSGEHKRGGELNLLLVFVFAALLVTPVFIYGIEIMRGIVQEKNDRVVEVLVCSMSPMQLLTGKVVGLAAVGLTQLSVWMMMSAVFAAYSGSIAFMSGVNLMQFLRPGVYLAFPLFFLLAYLLFVSIYAIGGAACNSEKDAQQLLAPLILIMMLPWFLLMPIVTNPESRLAVVLSLFPLFAPITMFVRILVSEPPMWQILLSIALTIVMVYALFHTAARIFRVGILIYGKRPTLPELWRWLRVSG